MFSLTLTSFTSNPAVLLGELGPSPHTELRILCTWSVPFRHFQGLGDSAFLYCTYFRLIFVPLSLYFYLEFWLCRFSGGQLAVVDLGAISLFSYSSYFRAICEVSVAVCVGESQDGHTQGEAHQQGCAHSLH